MFFLDFLDTVKTAFEKPCDKFLILSLLLHILLINY